MFDLKKLTLKKPKKKELNNKEENEKKIALGDDAELLLENAAFGSTLEEIVESSFQDFVTSKPDDKNKRECAYNHYRAIVDVVNTLKLRIQVRDQIIELQNQENEEPAP